MAAHAAELCHVVSIRLYELRQCIVKIVGKRREWRVARRIRRRRERRAIAMAARLSSTCQRAVDVIRMLLVRL